MISTLVDIGVSPIDKWNTELLDNVHPPNWMDAEADGVSEREAPVFRLQIAAESCTMHVQTEQKDFLRCLVDCHCVRSMLVDVIVLGKV